MTLRRLWPLGLLALALASTGCSNGRTNPPDTLVRYLNVAPTYPQLFFKRGQTQLIVLPTQQQLPYLAGAQDTWDTDTYTFHVTYVDSATNAEIEADSFTRQIASGTWYSFLLYEKAGNLTHAILESPAVPVSATDSQVQAFHANENVAAVDLYLEAPGADISAATPWGTVSFEGTLAPRKVPAGDYELVATEQGNPAHILYTSLMFTLGAGSDTTFVVTPDAGEGIAPFQVTVLSSSGGTVLVDQSLPGAIRVINGAYDQQPRDVAFNNEFTPPLFPGTPFATPTAYVPMATGADIPINVTPPGNPGVLELTGTFSPVPGAAYTLFFTGATGALIMNLPQDDRRRIKSQAKLVFYSAAGSCAPCDFFVVPAGTDLSKLPASDGYLTVYQQVSPGSVVPAPPLWAGDWEAVVRLPGTQTIVSGPTPITLHNMGLYGIVLSDDPNGTTIDMTLIDDFQ